MPEKENDENFPNFKNSIGNFKRIGDCRICFNYPNVYDMIDKNFDVVRVNCDNVYSCFKKILSKLVSGEPSCNDCFTVDLYKLKKNDFVYMYVDNIDLQEKIAKIILIERFFIVENSNSESLVAESLSHLKKFNYTISQICRVEELEKTLESTLEEKERLHKQLKKLEEENNLLNEKLEVERRKHYELKNIFDQLNSVWLDGSIF